MIKNPSKTCHTLLNEYRGRAWTGDSDVLSIMTGIRQRLATLGATTVLLLSVAVLMGATVGIGSFTFGYADGASCLRNNRPACANCHVMQGHLDAWVKSSYGKVATCT